MDADVNVFRLGQLIEYRPLFTGSETVEETVTFGVLIQNLAKFLRHWQAVFALVLYEPHPDDVARDEAKPLLLVNDYVEQIAPRQ